MDWQEKTIGKNSATPRTVQVPKGIDPGFAYNPGKAYLEPLTVPPLTGYESVLKERDMPWPTNFKPPPLPKPSKVSENLLLPANTKPEVAVQDFLDIFGATMDQGAVFTDAADTSMAITKALFVKGDDKGADNFKWLSDPKKADRLQYVNLLAMSLIEPDEIWWHWEKDQIENGRWRLKRRYLRAYEIAEKNEYAVSIFEWGRTGWSGSTAFMTTQKTEQGRQQYFEKMRIGKLVYKK